MSLLVDGTTIENVKFSQQVETSSVENSPAKSLGNIKEDVNESHVDAKSVIKKEETKAEVHAMPAEEDMKEKSNVTIDSTDKKEENVEVTGASKTGFIRKGDSETVSGKTENLSGNKNDVDTENDTKDKIDMDQKVDVKQLQSDDDDDDKRESCKDDIEKDNANSKNDSVEETEEKDYNKKSDSEKSNRLNDEETKHVDDTEQDVETSDIKPQHIHMEHDVEKLNTQQDGQEMESTSGTSDKEGESSKPVENRTANDEGNDCGQAEIGEKSEEEAVLANMVSNTDTSEEPGPAEGGSLLSVNLLYPALRV